MKITYFVLAAFLSSSTVAAAQTPLDYSGWTHCFGLNPKTCWDDVPILSQNVVIEYKDTTTAAPVLLLWGEYERSKEVFNIYGSIKSYRAEKVIYRFYKRDQEQWIFLGDKIFIRSQSPLNQFMPMFELNSTFGQEYIRYKQSLGKAPDQIKVPTLMFKD